MTITVFVTVTWKRQNISEREHTRFLQWTPSSLCLTLWTMQETSDDDNTDRTFDDNSS